MRLPINANISFRLPALILFMVALSVGIASVIAFVQQRNTSQAAAEDLLQALVAERGNEIETMMQNTVRDLSIMAARKSTISALDNFTWSWGDLGEKQTEILQNLYSDDNPNPAESKDLLNTAGDNSAWTSVHEGVHPEFRAVQRFFNYYDLFLIDNRGNVVYSVFKGKDFATNLVSGEWKDTGLATAFRAALDLPEGAYAFDTYRPYAPGDGRRAAFVAQPVFNSAGTRLGVLAYELNPVHITGITNNPAGLGETGQVYVVSADLEPVTTPRFVPSDGAPSGQTSNQAVALALQGQTGVTDYVGAGNRVQLAAFRPLSLFGQQWAMVFEKDKSEVFATLASLKIWLLGGAVLVILVFSALGVGFARSLTRPLNRAAGSMSKIADGKYDVEIADLDRADEIGLISRTLEKIRMRLVRGAKEEFENKFNSVAFANSDASIMMADKDMNITSLNASLERILKDKQDSFEQMYPGFTPDSVIGSSMDFFHPPAAREKIRDLIRDPDNLPYKANISIGDSRFTLVISMVQDDDGSAMGYVVEWDDVTAEFLNNAVLAAIDANQVKAEFTMDGAFIGSNAKFTSMMGKTQDDLTGLFGTDVFRFDEKMAEDRGAVFDRLKRGESVFGRFDLPRADGSIAVVDGGFSPVIDAKGKALRILMLGNDVTDAKLAIDAADARRREMEGAQNLVVDQLRQGLGRLSDGDLTVQIETEFSAEYEQLRQDFNTASARLAQAMHGVVENADHIRGEASEIASAAEDLSSRTERQAATLEETASALDELTSSVSSAADGAAHANRIVRQARENAESSGGVVREAVEAMSEIEESSKQISKITGVIDDIAFQTNLLALNAGVEAARAGEAGRGFAVVASEVRALAQRSSDAAREINELISASGSQVKRGVDLVDQAGVALVDIVETVSEINTKVSEIAISAREQSSGLAEINEAVNQLDQVTQQNAAMFEETTAASHALTREAEALTQTMGQFSIGQSVGAEAQAEIINLSKPDLPDPNQSVPQAAAVAPRTSTAVPKQDEDIEDGWDDF